jgi:hypothetical protein
MLLQITQSGNSLSGTNAATVRSAQPSGCDTIGQRIEAPVAGTIGGAAVTLAWTFPDMTINLAGNVSGGSMSGTLSGGAADGSETFAGTWSVVRQ